MQHHAEILLQDTVDETQALNIIQEKNSKFYLKFF